MWRLGVLAALFVSDLVGGVLERRLHPRLHHKCAVPEDKSDYKLAESWCTACYMETLMSLKKLPGSDMVIGANDGISFDPAWEFGYWKNVPTHTITWVEPNPWLFQKLKSNTEQIANKVLLNKAVRPASMSGDTLTLLCWNATMVDDVLHNRMISPLPKEVGPIKAHWNALCSLDRKNLEEASDVWKSMQQAGLSKTQKEDMMKDVREKWQVSHTVAARLPGELIADAGISTLRYLQIDVEGLDNEIIKSLPFDDSTFAPDLILYENHFGYDVKGFLEDHGYFVCCCLKQWGSNIVAVKMQEQNFSVSPYRPDQRLQNRVPTRTNLDEMLLHP